MPVAPLRLAAIETFKDLDASELARLEERLSLIEVRRGEELVREGENPDFLYVVVSGRFSVESRDAAEAIAEIGAGATVGEIAFFAGGTRTASVRAARDSLVVALSRADFDDISARAPGIWRSITASLAERLAAETKKNSALRLASAPRPRPRTVAVLSTGSTREIATFVSLFLEIARQTPGTAIVASAQFADHSSPAADSRETTRALNDLELANETVIFIADAEPTAWSEKVMRQADEILIVGDGAQAFASPVPLHPLEARAFALPQKPRHRLVLVHEHPGNVRGTRHWLANRDPVMHHHVAANSCADAARLWRFIRGDALGFVACGGGAYCAAHIGLYKAFKESGIDFDYLIGTSGGAAMSAAFAQDVSPDDIDARVHRMFIEGKALQRYTLPRYSIFDHTHFDRHLLAEYGDTLIEDMWKPYCAVSMDLADTSLVMHRTGAVWAAIRASAAIPALLPPLYTETGQILVDGSVIANVPVDVVHQIKTGPNIVVTFTPPGAARATPFTYGDLPARGELLFKSLTPWKRGALPKALSASTVLIRSLMANRNRFETHLSPDDWLLIPPTPEGMSALDWRRHRELVDAAYRYALSEIESRKCGPRGPT